MRWSNDHACSAMFDPLAHVLTFLTCSFLRVSKHRPGSPNANGSNIAKHAWSFDHRIDFDNSSVIDKGSFRIIKTLEAWHTFATKHSDNNSKPTPDQYSNPFKQQSPNLHVDTQLLQFSLFSFRLSLHIFCHSAFNFFRRRLQTDSESSFQF